MAVYDGGSCWRGGLDLSQFYVCLKELGEFQGIWAQDRKNSTPRHPRGLGATCALLCSVLAGYISGQNVHLDRRSYPALV